MEILNGQCYCGNIKLSVGLTFPPSNIHPRSCDCRFCKSHGAAYISDPRGSLSIQIGDCGTTTFYQGGDTDSQAAFHFCPRCGVLTHVLHCLQQNLDNEEEGTTSIIGAVNYRVIESCESIFDQPIVVSPKNLSTREKIERWKENWFSNLLISKSA